MLIRSKTSQEVRGGIDGRVIQIMFHLLQSEFVRSEAILRASSLHPEIRFELIRLLRHSHSNGSGYRRADMYNGDDMFSRDYRGFRALLVPLIDRALSENVNNPQRHDSSYTFSRFMEEVRIFARAHGEDVSWEEDIIHEGINEYSECVFLDQDIGITSNPRRSIRQFILDGAEWLREHPNNRSRRMLMKIQSRFPQRNSAR